MTCRIPEREIARENVVTSALHRFAAKLASLQVWTLVLAFGLATVGCTKTASPANNQSNANQNSSQSANTKSAAKPEQKSAGSIEVTSSPPGARVLLVPTDEGGAGEPQPKGITPTTITGVAPGKYTIDLEKPGYRFSQKEVRVKAGITSRVTVVLKKQ